MYNFKIRFNTECQNKEAENALCWRVLINDKEELASAIEINVPTRAISHTLENGVKKWSIECESDFYSTKNGKITIHPPKQFLPCVIWLTGLSGSGKTTIANALSEELKKGAQKVIILDGDVIRNLFPNTGFDKESRIKHNVNVGCIAYFLESQGYIVIVSLISPFKEARNKCRMIIKKFIEVYLNTPLAVCENRDVKGLYKKGRSGQIKDFTGISSPYEPPLDPEITINTDLFSLQDCVEAILSYLKANQ